VNKQLNALKIVSKWRVIMAELQHKITTKYAL